MIETACKWLVEVAWRAAWASRRNAMSCSDCGRQCLLSNVTGQTGQA